MSIARLATIVVLASLIASVTDWLFMGAMFHDRYLLYPEVWRGSLDEGTKIMNSELIGSAVNPVTGDYSRGATGFIIADGAPAAPVEEITIAGNLIDMFRAMVAADDLEHRRSIDVPTLRIEGMIVAGA